MKKIFLLIFLTSTLLLTGLTWADDFYIYPNAKQSKQQIEKDKNECYLWAKEKTGFDPMAEPTATEPPPPAQAPEGGVVRGGARGALLGVAVGAIAGDAGKGAAIGATAGALGGGMRRRDQEINEESKQQQWAAEQTTQYKKKRADYNRAYKACMEGRKYTIK